MYALLLSAAIALAGQVAAGSGNRYEQTPRTPAEQSVLPAQSEQPNANLPAADYRSQGRSQGRALGQQPPASSLSTDRSLQVDSGRGLLPSSSQASTASDSAATVKPSQLIRRLLKPPASSQLAGSPLSLAEVVEGSSSRSEQTQRIEAYWELAEATANYYLALRESIALPTMQRSVTQPSAEWERARQSLNQRGQVARRSALAAQVRLQRMLGSTSRELPLTRDLPHCGEYDTRYEEIFRGRLPSSEAQQLAELLSFAHQEIRSQAAHVVAAHQWRETVSQRRDPHTDGTGLLKAHELLSLNRRRFIQILCRYNVNIARYAEIASPGRVGTERLVAMLIYTDASEGTVQDNDSIRRTSAEEATNQGGSGLSRTSAAGRGNETRHVETPRAGDEHSILRRPEKQ